MQSAACVSCFSSAACNGNPRSCALHGSQNASSTSIQWRRISFCEKRSMLVEILKINSGKSVNSELWDDKKVSLCDWFQSCTGELALSIVLKSDADNQLPVSTTITCEQIPFSSGEPHLDATKYFAPAIFNNAAPGSPAASLGLWIFLGHLPFDPALSPNLEPRPSPLFIARLACFFINGRVKTSTELNSW